MQMTNDINPNVAIDGAIWFIAADPRQRAANKSSLTGDNHPSLIDLRGPLPSFRDFAPENRATKPGTGRFGGFSGAEPGEIE